MNKEKIDPPKLKPANDGNLPVNDSFRKRTFIEVFCKKCGERYVTDAEYEAVFADKAEAVECMQDSGWLVKGRDAFCENCH